MKKKEHSANAGLSNQTQVPNDIEIEKAFLYCIIMRNDLLKNCTVTMEDFYRSSHGKLFGVMATMYEDREDFDYAILTLRLRDMGILEECGGHSYIISFADTGASVALFGSYSNLLKELSARRKILDIIHNMTAMVHGATDVSTGISEAISELNEAGRIIHPSARALSDRVREWILVTTGNFLVTDVYRDLGVVTPGNKKAVLMALSRLELMGEVIKCGDKRGCYRPADINLERISFSDAEEDEFKFNWPSALPLQDMVKLYPGNLVIIQGEPESGKTAMMLNLIRNNLHLDNVRSIDYFSSEMGPTELKIRLQYFEKEGVPMSFWNNHKFAAWERSQDFPEVIKPDGVNLIDYIELHEEHYLIGKILMHIWRKLKKGIAVVAIQKDPGKKFGKGGAAIFEKPRLIVTLEPGKAIIEKGKNRRETNIDPKGKSYHYRIIDGCRFRSIQAPVKNKKGNGPGSPPEALPAPREP